MTSTVLRDPCMELVEAVDGLVTATAELRDAAAAKRDALVGCDPELILAATRGEEAAEEAVRIAEAGRAVALARAAESLGLATPPENVSAILPFLGEPARTRLAAARARLRTLVVEVTELNDLNRQLAQQSLGHLQSIFGVLAGERAGTTTYGPGAAARAYKLRGGAFLDRVA